METKKVLGIIFSLLFVGAFAFVLSWGIINFNKVKDGMSGTGVYTKEDINKSYEDGYNTALTDKEEYTKLIASYRDTITTLNDNISQLNSQVTILQNNNKDYKTQVSNLTTQKTNLQVQVENLTTIKTNNETTIASLNSQIISLQNQVTTLTNSNEDKIQLIATLSSQIITLQNTVSQLQTSNDMNVATITSLNTQIANLNSQISDMTIISQNSASQINALNNKINELQTSITYYERYIAQLENGEQVVATFEYDGSVYNIQIVNKGSNLSVITPTSTAYKIFNGWTVNGSTIDLSTYTITANTKIVADVTYKYDVKFTVDDTVYDSQIITKNSCATLPTNPTKDGYEFDGWSLNGVDVVSDIEITQVTENTTYYAVFTKLHTVTFIYENETISTQTIRNGNYATAVNIDTLNNGIFNGWKVNDMIVDLLTFKIVKDITFIADINDNDFVVVQFNMNFYGYDIVNFREKTILWLSGPQILDKSNLKWYSALGEGASSGGNSDGVGKYIWTDGNDYYLSYYQYTLGVNVKLDSEYSSQEMSWEQLIDGKKVWSDGTNIYYSEATWKVKKHYVFNKETQTWIDKVWNYNLIDGEYIWSDGTNIYYSEGSSNYQYVLDKTTGSWSKVTWTGLNNLYGNNIWSDGENIYYSNGSEQYVLDKTTNSWVLKTWTGLTSFEGKYIWSDGENYYYSYNNIHYKLIKKS